MEEIILHINVPACNRNMQGMEGRLKILTYSMLPVGYCTNICSSQGFIDSRIND